MNCKRYALLFTFVLAPIFSATAAEDVFKAVPSDAVFALRIHNLEYSLGQLDQYLVGLSPSPMATSMLSRMQLANILGDPNLSNINLRGDFAIFALTKPSEPNTMPNLSIAGILPITDYKKFIASNPTVSKPDANGISTVGANKMLIAPASDFAMITGPKSYTDLIAALKAAKDKSLASVLSKEQLTASTASNLWLFSKVEKINNAYGPLIISQLQKVRNTVLEKAGPNQPETQSAALAFSFYIDIIKASLEQSDTAAVAIDIKPQTLSFTKTVIAKSGSEFEKLLVPGTTLKKTKNLIGYLHEDSAITASSTIDKKIMLQWYEKLSMN